MASQVHPDGTDFEASIPYHRLVAELFVCGSQAVDGLLPGRLSPSCGRGSRRCCSFVADYTRPDGLAPQVGDGDDGRFLPLDDYGVLDPRDHRHLFRQAGPHVRARTAARPIPTAAGTSSAAATRTCSFTAAKPVATASADTATTTSSPSSSQRSVSRSSSTPGRTRTHPTPPRGTSSARPAFHSTLSVGGAEQNELRRRRPLPDVRSLARRGDRLGAESTRSGVRGSAPRVRGARSTGDAHAPAGARRGREHAHDPGHRGKRGLHELEWTFPLAPCETEPTPNGVLAHFDGVDAWIEGDVEFRVEDGFYSPRFGVRLPSPFVRATKRSRPVREETAIIIRFERP